MTLKVMRVWEGLGTEVEEAGQPCHDAQCGRKPVCVLGVGECVLRGERSVCIRREGVRVAVGRTARRLLQWSKQEMMVVWTSCKQNREH